MPPLNNEVEEQVIDENHKDHEEYEGDLTLDRLLKLREEIRIKASQLDDRIMMLTVQSHVRSILKPIADLASVDDRCDVAQLVTVINRELKKVS